MEHRARERVPIDAQSVEAPLSRSAVFLVLAAGAGDGDLARIRDLLGAVGDLVKNVGFRRPRRAAVLRRGDRVRAVGPPLAGRPAARPRPFAPIDGLSDVASTRKIMSHG